MYEIWMTTTTGGVPMRRTSKLETSQLDDGSKNKSASLNLFGRFTGKKAPPNSLRNWIDEQNYLAERIKRMGYTTNKPGVRRVPRDIIEDAIEDVNSNLTIVNRCRDDFIHDIPMLKQQILDAYDGDQCYNEVAEALNRFHPNPDRMIPVFGVADLCKDTGLVHSDLVQEAIVASELATKKSIVTILEEELGKLFERCHKPDRVRSQLKDMESLIEKLEPLVTEFSDSPELVEKLKQGLKFIKALPQDGEMLKEPHHQATVKQGMTLMGCEVETELASPPVEPDPVFEDHSFTPEDELVLDKSYEDQLKQAEVEVTEPEQDDDTEEEEIIW